MATRQKNMRLTEETVALIRRIGVAYGVRDGEVVDEALAHYWAKSEREVLEVEEQNRASQRGASATTPVAQAAASGEGGNCSGAA